MCYTVCRHSSCTLFNFRCTVSHFVAELGLLLKLCATVCYTEGISVHLSGTRLLFQSVNHLNNPLKLLFFFTLIELN